MLYPRIAIVAAAVLAAGIATAGAATTFNGVYTVDDFTNTGPQEYGDIFVGRIGTGTLNIFDGRLLRSGFDTSIGQAELMTPFSATGTVNVSGNHSRLEIVNSLRIATNGAASIHYAIGFLNVIAGGHVRADEVYLSQNNRPEDANVTVSGPGSLLEIAKFLDLRQSTAPFLRKSTVTIEPGGTVSVGTIITGEGTPNIFLEGGTLSLTGPAALTQQSWVHFNSGAFRFRSDQTLDGAAGFYTNFYGSPPVFAAGRGLTVDGITTLATSLLLDGGSLRTTRIAVNPTTGSIVFNGGTLTLAGEGAVIDDGGDYGPDPLTVGDGTGAAALLELVGAGHVRLGAVMVAADGALTFGGESLRVTSLDNGGRIAIADADLHVANGMLNTGSLSLADAVVEGDVTSPAGSTIDVAGTVVFNGNFTGAAAFYGSGTVVFNGSLSID